MASPLRNHRYSFLFVHLIFGGISLLGFLFPELFWGLHHGSFLPGPWPILLIIGASLLWFLPIYRSFSPNKTFTFLSNSMSGVVLVILSELMGCLFYKFSIYQDFYGDSHYIREQINQTITRWDPAMLVYLLKTDFSDPKVGTDSVYALVNLVSHLFEQNGQEALRWIDAVSGAIYVLIWVQLVRTQIQNIGLGLLLILMGLTAPFLLIFMGHMEVYAPSLVLMMGFLSVLLTYFRTKQKLYFALSWILFFLNLKFHITAFLLFPAISLASLYFMREFFPLLGKVFEWQFLFKWILTPILGIGLVLYFFVSESHFGLRAYTPDTLTDVIFLPLKASEAAPLDRYDLFSLSHLVDYGNQLFLWSGPALFLLSFILIHYRKQVNWQDAALMLVGISLILYFLAFFVLNPLLSMPVDWDLFSLPAPLLLVFVLLLSKPLQDSKLSWQIGGGMIALCLLSLPVFVVNTQASLLSQRLESIGTRAFETYWIGSSTSINGGIDLEPNVPTKLARRLAVLERLQPIAVHSNDIEYADLLCETGKAYFQAQDYHSAQPYFEEAFSYSPNLINNTYYLVVNHFYLQQFSAAHHYLPRLVAYQYPTPSKALSIAVHVSLEAEQYEDATQYAQQSLALKPGNKIMQTVIDSISEGQDREKIKFLFRQN